MRQHEIPRPHELRPQPLRLRRQPLAPPLRFHRALRPLMDRGNGTRSGGRATREDYPLASRPPDTDCATSAAGPGRPTTAITSPTWSWSSVTRWPFSRITAVGGTRTTTSVDGD